MEKMIFINQKTYLRSLNDVSFFINHLRDYKDRLVIFPSDLYIGIFKKNGFSVGSQDVSEFLPGAHTGDTSCESLKDIGCEYVLIGHSEVRKKNDSKSIILNKINRAKENGLKIILCVGEEDEGAIEAIERQLDGITDSDIYISYEPVWAIGSNRTPSLEKIENIVYYIKNKGFKKVLYGGSVTDENIKELNKILNLDGFLVGGCTLRPDSVIKMIEVVSK